MLLKRSSLIQVPPFHKIHSAENVPFCFPCSSHYMPLRLYTFVSDDVMFKFAFEPSILLLCGDKTALFVLDED